MQNLQKKIKKFWDKRLFLKKKSKVCCEDLLLTKLENNLILKYIKKKKKILDIGCGNGETIKFIIKKIYYKKITGVDFNKNLLKAAKFGTDKNVNFIKFNLLNDDYSILKKLKSDIIICKRVVHNFDYIDQKSILKKIFVIMKKNSQILFFCTFKDGLNKINKIRKVFNLPLIKEPYFNKYPFLKNIKKYFEDNNIKILQTTDFASTYFLGSRVLQSLLESNVNYNSKINKFFYKLKNIEGMGMNYFILGKKY